MLFKSNLLSRRISVDEMQTRLRWFLAIFILLLLIPMAILVERSYKQFQKEVYYIYKWNGEHAIIQFNEWMQTQLQSEEDRSYKEYQFYQLSNNPLYQRSELTLSPLARIQEHKNIPGMIGYFQVDKETLYSCPLLPFSDNETLLKESLGIDFGVDLSKKFNIEAAEVERRLSLRKVIRPLLIETGLLSIKEIEKHEESPEKYKREYPLKRDDEVEISSFQVKRSGSGDLLFYRDIWKGDEKIIQQGFAIDEAAFAFRVLKHKIKKATFEKKGLFQIFYKDELVLSIYYLPNEDSAPTIKAIVEKTEALKRPIYEKSLAAPLDDFHVKFSVSALPISHGAILGGTLLAIFIVIMSAGIFLIYRLGIRQIRLNEERLNFVSSVSHELKTPLTSIIMSAEMLREEMVVDEKKKHEYYNFIFFEGERLSRLISNILRLSKLGRDMPDITLEYTSVASAIDLVRSKISTLLENNQFELELKYSEQACEKCEVLIDTDAFTQIVINLVDNAVKFSKQVCEDDPSRRKIRLVFEKEENHKLCFSIRDYGPGISKEHSSHIFKIFYRAENELTRTTQGTGIGLALVYELVQAMGGEISFANREPGVEFKICFQSR